MDWIKAVVRRHRPRMRLNRTRGLRMMAQVLGLALIAVSAVSGWAAMNGQFIYVARNDGTIHVYDINNSHLPVKTNRVFTAANGDVRGVCASAASQRFFVIYNINNNNINLTTGYVACVDLTT